MFDRRPYKVDAHHISTRAGTFDCRLWKEQKLKWTPERKWRVPDWTGVQTARKLATAIDANRQEAPCQFRTRDLVGTTHPQNPGVATTPRPRLEFCCHPSQRA